MFRRLVLIIPFILVGSPLTVSAATGAVVNTPKQTAEVCKQRSRDKLKRRGYRPYDWVWGGASRGQDLRVSGSWRLGGFTTLAVECSVRHGASARYVRAEMQQLRKLPTARRIEDATVANAAEAVQACQQETRHELLSRQYAVDNWFGSATMVAGDFVVRGSWRVQQRKINVVCELEKDKRIRQLRFKIYE